MEEKNIVITYESLFDILRREKFNKDLQKLDKIFFGDVKKYLSEKEAILKSQENNNSVFASKETEKTRRMLKSAKTIIQELYEKRETKIIQRALFSIRGEGNVDTSMMLPEEENLFLQLQKVLSENRNIILKPILNEIPMPKMEKEKPLKRDEISQERAEGMTKIKFLVELPSFLGPDLNTYGPFNEGDEADLPEMVAENFINNKQAERL